MALYALCPSCQKRVGRIAEIPVKANPYKKGGYDGNNGSL